MALARATDRPRLQFGALVWRRRDALEILLVTSRETGRWVIPKGWPMKDRSGRRAAAREALEEAGVIGRVGRKSIGAFTYIKFLNGGVGAPCRVKVFPLEATGQADAWPEQGQRTLSWLPWREAAAAVHEPELAALMEAFAAPPPPKKKSSRKPSKKAKPAKPDKADKKSRSDKAGESAEAGTEPKEPQGPETAP